MVKEEYPDKDLIIHFLQPHTPYLTLGGEGERPNLSMGSNQSFTKKFRKTANTILRSVFPEKRISDLGKFLGLADYQRPSERMAENYSDRKLKSFYEENLFLALAELREMVNIFPDSSIVITSDHGEFLGENGLYGHHWDKEFLTEVPWSEVGELKEGSITVSRTNEKIRIEDSVRHLKSRERHACGGWRVIERKKCGSVNYRLS